MLIRGGRLVDVDGDRIADLRIGPYGTIAEVAPSLDPLDGEPVSDAAGKKITTIEGLSTKGDHPLQKAWVAEQVPQCGYCQSGQIMQAAGLLSKNANPTKEEVVAHMDGNLCRCMTYSRIQKAIMRAASEMRTASNTATERSPT